jgi:hypothetical protein
MAIEKSYIDMLKERDAKIEALRELLKLAHESLDSKDERIAELEKERDQILKAALDSESNYCELKDSLPAHNLEQQAKSIEDFVEPYVKYGKSVYEHGLRRAIDLRNQAKELKEGNKDESFHFNDQDFQPEAQKEQPKNKL